MDMGVDVDRSVRISEDQKRPSTPVCGAETLTIVVPGAMRGKGRPRFGNGRTYTDAKTVSAENWIKSCAVDQIGTPVLECAVSVSIVVEKAVPPSWSAKKKGAALLGAIHATGKPDWDNAGKLACDSLNGIAWKDDSQIVAATYRRRFGPVDQTTITITPLV